VDGVVPLGQTEGVPGGGRVVWDTIDGRRARLGLAL